MVPATVVLTATALAATNPGARDTTFVVPEGARIEIEHREGDIRVMGVASREARVVLDDDDGRIRVQSSGGTIRLGSSPSGDGADLLIAATALEHGLTVVTRNVRHFEPTGVPMVDPSGRAPRKRNADSTA